MEFCQLGDLATFVKKRDKLAAHPVTSDMLRRYPNPPGLGFSEVVVRHFAQQLATALEFLRSKNLVHRDLKPQNLLLNPPPAWLAKEKPENRPYEVSKNSLKPLAGLESLPFLKIADFGFARHLPQTTMAETLCGSPLYMAPEILRYEKYDAKADLWSVGTVLYELMVGKPPFRAANHVELLRKIERTMDKIKFPDELVISDEMKKVIRALLKKMPTERMSWESFFQSAIIVDEIPGLVATDRMERKRSIEGIPESTKIQSDTETTRESMRARRDSYLIPEEEEPASRPSLGIPLPESQQHGRPPLQSYPTAPAVHGVRNDRIAGDILAEKRLSRPSPSPEKASPKSPKSPIERERERERPTQQFAERSLREARERAAQDVAFERDYVMVEKRAVEVNAFADELAANPRISQAQREATNTQAPNMARRASTQNAISAAQSAPSNASRQMQVARMPEGAHQRRYSYERSYGAATSSASSALAKALSMVNQRFMGGSPLGSMGKGPSPPQGYGPYPAFPSSPAGPFLLGDAPRSSVLDEDQKLLATLEDCATRSDVVFGFSEVKYKQLIPAAPSNDNPLGIRRSEPDSEFDDDELTVDAIVGLSEEALVLYVKALAILTNTIDLAGNWWNHKSKGEILAEVSGSPRSREAARNAFLIVGTRVNNVVQWARNRFNECLEKSEYVSRKLQDAQKRLPPHHPGHPNNHPIRPITFSATTDIHLSTGVTAEKLMYDRALEMSKTAAVNELVNEDLPGCEVSYVTALRLLEAVLEKDNEHSPKNTTRKDKPKEDDDDLGLMEEGDRKVVLKRKRPPVHIPQAC